jgi:hypothetical protein
VKRLAILLLFAACSPKPSPVPPDQWAGDAGACQVHWAKACANAIEHGMGQAFPLGCTQAQAEAHCK